MKTIISNRKILHSVQNDNLVLKEALRRGIFPFNTVIPREAPRRGIFSMEKVIPKAKILHFVQNDIVIPREAPRRGIFSMKTIISKGKILLPKSRYQNDTFMVTFTVSPATLKACACHAKGVYPEYSIVIGFL